MASIDLKRSHTMDTEDLREAVEELLVSFRRIPWTISRWFGMERAPRREAKGRGFKASFSLSPSDLAISVELSMLARAFKRGKFGPDWKKDG